MRVLIVEDTPSKVTVISQLVEETEGFEEVVTVATEEEALNQFTAHPFEMVICDIHLSPDCKGEGLRIMRKFRERLISCVIICFTSGSNEICAQALASGADMVVSTQWSRDGWLEVLLNYMRIGQILALDRNRSAESL